MHLISDLMQAPAGVWLIGRATGLAQSHDLLLGILQHVWQAQSFFILCRANPVTEWCQDEAPYTCQEGLQLKVPG